MAITLGAKLGFDAPLTVAERQGLPPFWRHIRSLNELMLVGGQEWWREHGGERKMIFDLRPNSLSFQVLAATKEK